MDIYQLRCRPEPQHELLLQAALLNGPQALKAWNKWIAVADLDRLDGGSYRLLPALYRNLAKHGVNGPVLDKLKGVYRHTLYKNHLYFYRLAGLLRSFEDKNIQAIILKGAALTLLYYKDYGLRPMNDIDLLVKTEEAPAAAELLSKLGWQPGFGSVEELIKVRHSTFFIDQDRRELDLHWHLLWECCEPEADKDFWAGAKPLKLADVTVYALSPTDQLLHVCVHGVWWNAIAPIRWVQDAMTILNNCENEINWERLYDQAVNRRFIIPLRETLTYLKEAFDAPVPATFLESLWSEPTTTVERIVYKYITTPWPNSGYLFVNWYLYSRMSQNKNIVTLLSGFHRYLLRIWGLDTFRKAPAHIFKKIKQAYMMRRQGINTL